MLMQSAQDKDSVALSFLAAAMFRQEKDEAEHDDNNQTRDCI